MRVVGGTVEDSDICGGAESNGEGCKGVKDTSLAHTWTTHLDCTRLPGAQIMLVCAPGSTSTLIDAFDPGAPVL